MADMDDVNMIKVSAKIPIQLWQQLNKVAARLTGGDKAALIRTKIVEVCGNEPLTSEDLEIITRKVRENEKKRSKK